MFGNMYKAEILKFKVLSQTNYSIRQYNICYYYFILLIMIALRILFPSNILIGLIVNLL